MSGMATQLFLKSKNQKDFPICKAALHPFPFLKKLVDQYGLNLVDLKLAELILLRDELKSESVAAFIVHLSLSVRNGHLLVKRVDNQILPSIESIWKKEADFRQEEIEKVEKLVLEGFSQLKNNPLFLKIISFDNEPFPTRYLCLSENKIYFQRYFRFETESLNHLKRIIETPPLLKINQEHLKIEVDKLLQNKRLLEAQGEAILKAASLSLTFISGGPGTGKTYTAGYLIRLLLESLPEDERKNIKVSLAAPTGKAAANLENSLSSLIGKNIENEKGKEVELVIKAKTLHQLLSLKEGVRESKEPIRPLSADIILIDESSMIDVVMMAKLLSSIKKGARVIFLGDPDQLASVEAGAIFSDLIKLLPSHLVNLNTCLRAELEEIVDFGKAINFGKSDLVLKMLEKGNAVKRVNSQALTEDTLFHYTAAFFPTTFKENATPLDILNAFNCFRILSPLRKGPFGVDHLNQFFFYHLMKKAKLGSENKVRWVPIILLKNDSALDLYNGQVAVLGIHAKGDKKEHFVKEGDYALFPDKKNGYRKVQALLLPSYEYAYCLSVHKAQGSEFEHVLCLLPEGSEHFGKEVLYTAVTRARKRLEIFGTDEQLIKTIKKKGCRLSGISDRWNK